MNQLPCGWRMERLGNVLAKPPRNGIYKPSGQYGRGTLIVRINDFDNDGVLRPTRLSRVEATAEERAQFGVRHGDVLINRVNSLSHLGKCTVVPELGEPVVFESNMMRVRLDTAVLHPDFLGYYLSLPRTRRRLQGLAKRAVAQASINQGDVTDLSVPVPPVAEQLAIHGVATAIRGALDARSRELALERERKAALANALFASESRRDWSRVRLGDVCAVSTGSTPSTANPLYYQGAVPYVRTFQITNCRIRQAAAHISEEAVKDYGLKIYPPGTVLLAMYGQGKTRGQTALLEIAATTSQNAAAILSGGSVDSEFLWQWLTTRYEDLRGVGHHGLLSHLNLAYVKRYVMPLPPLAEQREIAAVLKGCDAKIAALEREIALLDELFRALLEELMSGRLSALPLVEAQATT